MPATTAAPRTDPAPRPWLLAAVIVAGVLVHAPSLAGGFYADDHLHVLALDGKLPLPWWSLFDFGTASDWARLADDAGGFPWWTSPDWKIRFFRPLSSALLALDHSVFGAHAAAHHAVSLAWLALLFVVSHAAARAVGLSARAAAGAVALLASSQATTYPAEWLANRNSLVAATCTAAAVTVLAGGARTGRGRALAAALGLALLAALAKESGLAAFAAIAAWLVLADHGLPAAWARRAAAASAGCAAAYGAALVAAGFGTRSEFYATPWADPGPYAARVGGLATTGLLALLTPVPSDLTFLVPGLAPAFAAGGVLVGVPFLVWSARRLRGDRTAAFLAVWAVAALLPEAGAPLQDRLLLGAGVPFACLLATLLSRTLPAAAGRPRLERIAARALVASAAVEALLVLGQSAAFAESARTVRAKIAAADVGPRSLGRRDVFVLQGDDPLVVFTLPSTWAVQTGDLGVRFVPLQMGRRGLRWTRVDDRTMEFTSLGKPFVTEPFETVYRSPGRPAPAGFAASLPGVRFEIVATDPAGGARTVRATFDTPPDGDRVRFLAPRDGRLTRIAPPAPGESVVLPEAPRAHPFVP